MTLLLDTSAVPPRERAPLFEAALDTATLPARVRAEPGVQARVEFWRLAPGTDLNRHTTSGYRLTRTGGHLRAAAPERVSVAVTLAGEHRLAQGELRWQGRPGALRLLDLTCPYDLDASGPCTAQSFQVDHARLALPVDAVRRAVPHVAASPLYDLLRRHVLDLPRAVVALPSPDGRAMLAAATTELVRALVTSVGTDERAHREAMGESLFARVTAWAQEHLAEPGLGPADMAAAHDVSVRHLHAVFAARGLRPAGWVVRQRLEGARAELAHTAAARPQIAVVARRWGFPDAGHFARRFRGAYGLTPRDWVAQNAPAGAARRG
ncbi:helix-turn-helix domain-containing protein [Kineococcus sp. NUM-3379]